MQKVKKIPLRKCLGCNEMKPKKELIRIVRSPANDVSIDKTGKAAGRGCYICPNMDCLEKAIKAKRVQNALEVQVDAEVFEQLRGQLNKSE
ncbi:MAG: nucleic acid-binding protein [Clostridiales bacterium GWB2_37_7]|nr:MAG: nucleic acid-binding protein [Clostridiales bacterium GWB2_37_7]